MAEIVAITAEPTNASTITLLENMLELARSGALSSIGMRDAPATSPRSPRPTSTTRPDGRTRTRWSSAGRRR